MSAEYGWTDDQIGELPLARLRQITANIQIRKYQASREENSRFSWLARHLTGYIAMGYMVEKGQVNEPLQNASTLGFDDIERAMLGGLKAEAETKQAENKPGSYETFMRFAHQDAKNKG